MLEFDEQKYTLEALRILKCAKVLADFVVEDFVSTEHLLNAIICSKGSGVGTEIFKFTGAKIPEMSPYQDMEEKILKRIKGGPVKLEATPKVKQALEVAGKWTKKQNLERIGTGAILYGILSMKDSIGARRANSVGISEKIVRELLADPLEEDKIPAQTNQSSEKGQEKNQESFSITKFTTDLTDLARKGKLDPVVGRTKEIERLLQTLSRKKKNNPVLLGEPGVGKTAIVEGLARRIASGDVPKEMCDRRILSLDLSAMVAGTRYRGSFEDRIKKLLDEVSSDDTVILFIDEIHTLIGAGSAEGSLDAANIIKPSLARGEVKVIGATTVKEYRKYIEKDAALERRFQPVYVEEPDVEDAVDILKGIREAYEEYHQVCVTDEAIQACVDLSKRYIADRVLPDKAIDLLDEAAAYVHLLKGEKGSKLERMEESIQKLEEEKEKAVFSGDIDELDALNKKQRRLMKRAEKLKNQIGNDREKRPQVTGEDIGEMVGKWTGIPVKDICESEKSRLNRLEKTLHQRVIAQEEAVKAVSKAVRRSRAGLKDPKRPIGSFLFLGPTGVGKTELSKVLAKTIFGKEEALIRLDMSEYMESYSVSKLLGSAPGYVGFEDGGQLTERVRKNPYSVILFDEIEKAHPDVFNVFLQILDDGFVTDSKGRKADFKNTVIIMTSNCGAQSIIKPKNLGFGAESTPVFEYQRMKERVMEAVQKSFKPEFINRIDELIVFHPLDKADLKAVLNIQVRDVIKRVKDQLQIDLRVTEKGKAFVLEKSYDPKYGARPLRRGIQTYLEDPLADELLSSRISKGDRVRVTVKEEQLVFEPMES